MKPLNLTSSIVPSVGVYAVVIDLANNSNVDAISPDLRQRLAQHGNFTVNIGGTVTPDLGDPVTEQDDDRLIPQAFPITRKFASADYASAAHAASMASAWRDHVVDVISSGLTTFLALDLFVETKTHNLPL